MFTDDERAYGYVAFMTGDEMSKRKKFAFIAWIGPGVGPLKKAAVSTDKAFVKEICPVSHCQSVCLCVPKCCACQKVVNNVESHGLLGTIEVMQ